MIVRVRRWAEHFRATLIFVRQLSISFSASQSYLTCLRFFKTDEQQLNVYKNAGISLDKQPQTKKNLGHVILLDCCHI